MRNSNNNGIMHYCAGGVGLFLLLLAPALVLAGDEETVARNFLKYLRSPKTILSEEVLERSLLDPGLTPIAIAHLFQLEGGGYILVSKDRSISPVKAYSLTGDFASLPEAYRAALLAELELRCRVALSSSGLVPQEAGLSETEARWNFLLGFDASRQPLEVYAPDTFLLTSHWNQGYPYNKFLPAIAGQTVLAGCVNVAVAQIMRYYRYPAQAKGVLSYPWNNQTLKTVLYRSLNWDNMPDIANATTSDHLADEVALLIKDLGIANRTAFGITDSSTSFRPEVLKENFSYSTFLATRDNNTAFEGFLTTIKSEIMASRPLLLSFPTHMVVADGYSAGDAGQKIHLNMGWGGTGDDFYFLDRPVEPKDTGKSFDTSAGKLSIHYNIKPCSASNDDCATNREKDDDMTGLAITGNFNRAKDEDLYEAYLKGPTSFTATRGFSNVAFYVSLINAADGSEAFSLVDPSETGSANKVISAGDLPAGKYLIRAALCNDSGSCFSYETDPTKASFNHYSVTLSTGTVSAEERAVIDQALNKPPFIGNDFPDIILNAAAPAVRRILIDARDENGDAITLSLGNSNPAAVNAVLNGKILEITPTGQAKVSSRIVVTASANGQTTEKAFVVMTDSGQTAFGKAFTIGGLFTSQSDVKTHHAILEGSCTIQGYNGYSNQAFYTSVLDGSGNVITPANDVTINAAFSRGLYQIRASLQNSPFFYAYKPESANYVLTVTCPAADARPLIIAGLLGIDLAGAGLPIVVAGDLNGDGTVNMIDAILTLQLLSGMDMSGKTIRLFADVDGGGRITPVEAVFVLQKAAGLR